MIDTRNVTIVLALAVMGCQRPGAGGDAAASAQDGDVVDASAVDHIVDVNSRDDRTVTPADATIDSSTLGGPAPLDVAPAQPTTRDVRVLHYNLYWGDNAKYRTLAGLLVQKVAQDSAGAPDVVLIQEAFKDERPEPNPFPVFRDQLNAVYPYQAHGPLRGSNTYGSGLVILSRIPIAASASMKYAACAGVDCFASKGAVEATLDLGGACGPVAFFDTHTQAGKLGDYKPLNIDPAKARKDQISEFAAFVRKHAGADDGGAAIAGGDFNFFARPNDPSDVIGYATMISGLKFINAEGYCSGHTGSCAAPFPIGDGQSGMLKAFFRASADGRIRVAPVAFGLLPSSSWGGLGDHDLIETVYRFTCQ